LAGAGLDATHAGGGGFFFGGIAKSCCSRVVIKYFTSLLVKILEAAPITRIERGPL